MVVMVVNFYLCVCVWRPLTGILNHEPLERIGKGQKIQLLQPLHNVTGTGVVDRALLKGDKAQIRKLTQEFQGLLCLPFILFFFFYKFWFEETSTSVFNVIIVYQTP